MVYSRTQSFYNISLQILCIFISFEHCGFNVGHWLARLTGSGQIMSKCIIDMISKEKQSKFGLTSSFKK